VCRDFPIGVKNFNGSFPLLTRKWNGVRTSVAYSTCVLLLKTHCTAFYSHPWCHDCSLWCCVFSSQNMCMCGLHLLECVTFLQAVSEAVSCLHQWCHIVEKGLQISSKNMCMCGLNLLECVTVLQSVSEAVSCLHQWCHIIVEKGSQIIILCLSNVSREMLPTPSLHTPSTDRLILSKALDQGSCQMQSTASVIGHHRPDSAIPLRP
jgi:hypothetical protein